MTGLKALLPNLTNEIENLQKERETAISNYYKVSSLEDFLERTNLHDVLNDKYAHNRKTVKISIYKHIKELHSGDIFGEKALDSEAKIR